MTHFIVIFVFQCIIPTEPIISLRYVCTVLEVSYCFKVAYFPGGPVVKMLPSNAWGMGSVPGWGAKIPHALWCRTNGARKLEYLYAKAATTAYHTLYHIQRLSQNGSQTQV